MEMALRRGQKKRIAKNTLGKQFRGTGNRALEPSSRVYAKAGRGFRTEI